MVLSHGLFLGLSAVTFLVAALIFLVVPESRSGVSKAGPRDALAGLRQIYGDGFFWRLAPIGIFCSGTSMAIQSLWAGPWRVMGYNSPMVPAAQQYWEFQVPVRR